MEKSKAKPQRSEPAREPDPGLREQIHLATSRCPYCHDDVVAQQSAVCQDCLARHHPSCWAEADCCSSCQGTSPLERHEQGTAGGQEYFSSRSAPKASIAVAVLLFAVGGMAVASGSSVLGGGALPIAVAFLTLLTAFRHVGKPLFSFSSGQVRIRRPGWGLRSDLVIPLGDVLRTEVVDTAWQKNLYVHYRDRSKDVDRRGSIPLAWIPAGELDSIRERLGGIASAGEAG